VTLYTIYIVSSNRNTLHSITTRINNCWAQNTSARQPKKTTRYQRVPLIHLSWEHVWLEMQKINKKRFLMRDVKLDVAANHIIPHSCAVNTTTAVAIQKRYI
jgi:hypothetical protein